MAEQKGGRLLSLDVYRGLIMLTLASSGFGLHEAAKHFPENQVWQKVAFHTDHPKWVSNHWVAGVSYWDLIQPAFMFMVGVSMPYSYARRLNRGDSMGSMALHALVRSIVLVLLGVFLSSAWDKQTNWTFVNVLSQIGLGYFVLFWFLGARPVFQAGAIALILVGTWVAFVLYQAPPANFDYAAVGVPSDWTEHFTGIAAHFNKNSNVGWKFDTWFLNLFPRTTPFKFNEGGYATLNFVPSLATMMLGLMSGELLRGSRPGWAKAAILLCAAAVCLGLGLAAGFTVCPIVKRIWTPSWVLFSGGYVLAVLALLYLFIDVIGLKFWTWPLVVLGTNSILLYLMGQLLRKWVANQLLIHFGNVSFHYTHGGEPHDFNFAQAMQVGPYHSIWWCSSVMLVFWLICAWLHRQRTFVRI